ncbi:MAG: choice-of-anchor J domain-containing protein [Flavobacteriaceae bacterium]|jgi:gliding motility-associated-like protein|nr:choice-of-anchor J domain-containing protein [Flavobacteriaceae bacterium]
MKSNKVFFTLFLLAISLVAFVTYAKIKKGENFGIEAKYNILSKEEIKTSFSQLLHLKRFQFESNPKSLITASCSEPTDVETITIGSTNATFAWKSSNGSSYEYYVQDLGGNIPNSPGNTTTTPSAVVTGTTAGIPLQPNSYYEFYVKTKCGSTDESNYVGPLLFKTSCTSMTTFPFEEGFNTNSATFSCWSIVDANNDKSSDGLSRIWQRTGNYRYEGDGAMIIYGSANPHDDWLISPAFQFATGKMYEITYYYSTTNSSNADLELLVSNQGIDLNKFVSLKAKKTVQSDNFKKEVFYINNISGDVNIAWHVSTKGATTLAIDKVSVKEVTCQLPNEDVVISNIQKNSVTLNWTDVANYSWLVYVQPQGGTLPTTGGTVTNNTSITLTNTNGTNAGALQPNTAYEFYIRGICGTGKQSDWIGPFVFRTACDIMAMPFTEGFNSNSTTVDCWTPINKVGNNSTTNFENNLSGGYEGDGTYILNNSGDKETNHYLISPTFSIQKSKIYRLSYYYKTTKWNNGNPLEVLLSSAGKAVDNFKTILVPMQTYKNEQWIEKIEYISGITGDINIAWHSKAMHEVEISLDKISFEEISCTQPLNVETTQIESVKAQLSWKDQFNKEWEYVLLPYKVATLNPPTGSGVVTNSNSITVTKDFKGLNLQPNTHYAYYIRSKCDTNTYSSWVGPFDFYTICSLQNLPFWEGFNTVSKSSRCWTVLDKNGAIDQSGEKWKNSDYLLFEGDSSIVYEDYSYDGTQLESWLISPDFDGNATKYYRLKYHYSTMNINKASLEVKVSNNGLKPVDFKQVIVPAKQNTNEKYKQEVAYFTGVKGKFSIGFHVFGGDFGKYSIDNVYVEEVQGCVEPTEVQIVNIQKQQADITWTDHFGGTKWEYYVQEVGLPIPTTNGTITQSKTNTITKETNGTNLIPGKEYEVYVRTVCANGSYSIWQESVKFLTTCNVVTTPFKESFDTTSNTVKCWSTNNANKDDLYWKIDGRYPFEGDQSVVLVGKPYEENENDDWLISPVIKTTNAAYLLKFRYRTGTFLDDSGQEALVEAPMEILLSIDGSDPTDFKYPIESRKIYKSKDYTEEIILFNGANSNVNIAWHVESTKRVELYIDNVSLTEVKNCVEPINVQVVGTTTTSVDIAWNPINGITSWEVLVLPHRQKIPDNPSNLLTINNSTQATINNLVSGKPYDVYVRAQCNVGNTKSDWSTKLIIGLKAPNDICSQAIPLSINQGVNCNVNIPGSFIGATDEYKDNPDCIDVPIIDVWYEFTADSDYIAVNLNDFIVGKGAISPRFFMTLYDGDCNTISANSKAPMSCKLQKKVNNSYSQLFGNLVVGRKYYLRLAITEGEYYYTICLNNNKEGSLLIVPSGDQYKGTTYSVDHLVNKVLVNSKCKLVDNIKYQSGDNSGINTLGYFNKAKSIFPFEEGIVLTTQYVYSSKGPYDPDVNKRKVPEWFGDADLNNVINTIGGEGFGDRKYTSVLEFDFIPIKDSIKFDYLFASESYVNWCDFACKGGGALFAAWLTEVNTGEGKNLAIVPTTDLPIALSTIRDSKKTNTVCNSINPEYFGQHYYQSESYPLASPINYAGQTIPMSSETVYVKPGVKYRIKLAIADFCATSTHTSAVFFKAGSFDIDGLKLGPDLLVETNNAVCGGSSKIIHSGLSEDTTIVSIQWEKDGKAISGATKPNYEVTQAGTYTVKAQYKNIECPVEGSIKVEFYPPIKDVVTSPKDLSICRFSLTPQEIDLVSHTSDMFVKTKIEDYKTTFYLDAACQEEIKTPEKYSFTAFGKQQIIYIKVEKRSTGCHALFDLKILPKEGDKPAKIEDVVVCEKYILPKLPSNQRYFSLSNGKGNELKEGDILHHGNYTIFVVQENGKGCYEETSFNIKVLEKNYAKVFEDRLLRCEIFQLTEKLGPNANYYKESNGKRILLPLGTMIPEDNTTIFVVAITGDNLCTDESKFVIRYDDCPIPKGFSPNNDGINDRFDLSQHGVTSIKVFNRNGAEVYSFSGNYTNEWDGKSKSSKQLPSGTYYYVIQSFSKTKTGWVQIEY